jgi:hypothetical protein
VNPPLSDDLLPLNVPAGLYLGLTSNRPLGVRWSTTAAPASSYYPKYEGRIKQRVVRAESSRGHELGWIFESIGIVLGIKKYSQAPPAQGTPSSLSFCRPMATTIPPGTETEDDNEIRIQRISSGFSSGSPLDHTMDRIGMGKSDCLFIPNFI